MRSLLRLSAVATICLLAACANDRVKYQFGSDNARVTSEVSVRQALQRALNLKRTNPLDEPVEVLSASMPEYPPELTGPNVEAQGRVRVNFLVDESGNVSQANARPDADPRLVELCLQTIKKWKFRTIRRGGLPVSEWLTFEFVFRLE